MAKRFIDANALLEILNKKASVDYEMGLYNHGALTESFVKFVEKQPTADVVEVVRCRDCKHYVSSVCRHDFALHFCRDDDFCSYGERRKDD